MARAAYVVICLAAMAALYGAIHWAVYGFSRDFGLGLGAGVMATLILYRAAEVLEKSQRDRA
jgi:hypothetical protein